MDEEYFRLILFSVYCHTDEADELFDGPISRSMDRNHGIEDLLWGTFRAELSVVILDFDYNRIGNVINKIVRGLDYTLAGKMHPQDQQFYWDFIEVDGPSEDTRFGPDFSFHADDQSWEMTFYDSLRFTVYAA